MDKKKINKLVAAIMVGNRDEIEPLITECVRNYSAERRDELVSHITKNMHEAKKNERKN